MTYLKPFPIVIAAVLFLSAIVASAQTKIEGVIKERSGSQLTVQTADSSKVIVQLTDRTEVGQAVGVLKARKKKYTMAALIPGLPVQVEGTYDAQNQLVAAKVKFKGEDLEQAQANQMYETQVQADKNKAELEKHNAELAAQNEALKAQQQALTEQEKKIAANKEAIAANSARFGQLHDYFIIDELTVYFANGKTKVDPKYNPQLVALAEKAKATKGYMIEVKGYASSSGSAAVNQRLSEDRAGNVTKIILQDGHIPLTNMLAPGAMGESRQIEGGKKDDSEAENRRVRVRILQNKAIAGL